MTNGVDNSESGQGAEVIHLPKRRSLKSEREGIIQEIELSIAAHFREQNEILQVMNKALSEKVQRLTVGVERLVEEMHGVRTGKKSEAFARVGGADASPDLPTVSAEAALVYTLTSGDIGEQLGFHSSQIGLLLSSQGLNWAGNGDYQEIGRHHKKTLPKFWHRDVVSRLRDILDANRPDSHGVKSKAVFAIFRKWSERKMSGLALDGLAPNDMPH